MTLPRSEARPPSLLATLPHSLHPRLPAHSSHFSPSRFPPLPIIPSPLPQLSLSAPAHPPPRSLSTPGFPRHRPFFSPLLAIPPSSRSPLDAAQPASTVLSPSSRSPSPVFSFRRAASFHNSASSLSRLREPPSHPPSHPLRAPRLPRQPPPSQPHLASPSPLSRSVAPAWPAPP